MRPVPRPWRWCGAAALALLVLWLGGLAAFCLALWSLPGDPPTPTDAIVVLTGGRQRVETGLALLAEGRGKKLFISGVNQRVDRDMLLRALGPAAEREACCIVVGHQADNTFGNAAETAIWMRQEGYASLRLVTSWYHVPRSLLEFRRAMPRLTIVAHPVSAQRAEFDHWWGWHGAAVLVVGEYNKYLATWLQPLLPSPGAAQRGSLAI